MLQTVGKRIFEATLDEDEAFNLGCASYIAETVRRGEGEQGGQFYYALPEDMRADIRRAVSSDAVRG